MSAPSQAQSLPHRAGLVVQYGDGSVETACVRFSEESISGLDLLERAGVAVVVQSGAIGTAVCKIGPDGCDYPAEQCFCERDGPRSIYWAYYTGDGSSWTYAIQSAAGVTIRDGDLNGWAWGLGDSGSGAAPPLIALDAICAEPTATALPPSPEPSRVAQTQATPIATIAVATPAPAQEETSDNGLGGYVGFVVLAAILLIGGVITARRRG